MAASAVLVCRSTTVGHCAARQFSLGSGRVEAQAKSTPEQLAVFSTQEESKP